MAVFQMRNPKDSSYFTENITTSQYMVLQKLNRLFYVYINGYEALGDSLKKIIEKEINQLMKPYTKLGSGVTASAWKFGRYVLRVEYPWSDGEGYSGWAKYSQTQWKNSSNQRGIKADAGAFPKIHYINRVTYYGNAFGSIVVMEKLESLIGNRRKIFSNCKRFLADLQVYLTDGYPAFQMKEIYEDLQRHIRPEYRDYFTESDFREIFKVRNKFSFNDCHEGNLMFCPTSKRLVLTDPSY